VRFLPVFAVALSLASCASSPPPDRTSGISVALEAICDLREVIELSGRDPIWVASRTRPFSDYATLFEKTSGRPVTTEALTEIRREEAAYIDTFVSAEVPRSSCRRLRITDGVPPPNIGALEISDIVKNPFSSPPSRGVFARISLGQLNGARHVWVELMQAPGGEWNAVRTVDLGRQD